MIHALFCNYFPTYIQSRETTPVSMMPEGLLSNLSDQEVLDLVGYLRGRVE